MNAKKIKRKCMVKGCKNTDTYTISKVRDFGDTVLICKDCLQEALKAIKDYGKPKPPEQPKEPDKPLFYNHLTQQNPVPDESEPAPDEPVTDESTSDKSTTDETVSDESATDESEPDNNVPENPDTQFICPKCGKVCGSQIGLISHQKSCGGGDDE